MAASPTVRSSGRCWTRRPSRRPLSERFWSGNSVASPGSGSTPWPSSPCSGARGYASSQSPSTQTTPPRASSWRPSSSPLTSSTRKILPRRFGGECGKQPPEASGSPAGRPTAMPGSWCRTGPRSDPPSNPIPRPLPLCSASSLWPRRARASWTSRRPSTPRASPTPRAGSGPRTASTSSSATKPTPAPFSGASAGRTRPSRCGWTRRSPP